MAGREKGWGEEEDGGEGEGGKREGKTRGNHASHLRVVAMSHRVPTTACPSHFRPESLLEKPAGAFAPADQGSAARVASRAGRGREGAGQRLRARISTKVFGSNTFLHMGIR